MIRLYPMSEVAKVNFKCNLGDQQGNNVGQHLPTHWYVAGDCKGGYRILHVDQNLCGFDVEANCRISTLRYVKSIVNDLNNGQRFIL